MQTLLQTPHLVVRGEGHIATSQTNSTEEGERTFEHHAINLDIVLQVNGSIRTFSRGFNLGFAKDGLGHDCITLIDWLRWREFYDVMADFGYHLSPREVENIPNYAIIKKWIREIEPEYQYIEDYDGTAVNYIERK